MTVQLLDAGAGQACPPCRLLAGVVAELRQIHELNLEDEITSKTERIPETPTELFAALELHLAAKDAEAAEQMGWSPFTLSLDFVAPGPGTASRLLFGYPTAKCAY
jgi:hypothetical protein